MNDPENMSYRMLRKKCFKLFPKGEKPRNCSGKRRELLERFLEFSDQRSAIVAVSYNLSFASQLNVAMGSEKDFVEQCQRAKRLCYFAALDKIQRIGEEFGLDVLGIQEVEDAQMVDRIASRIPALDSYYRAGVWNRNVNKYVGAMLMWNSKKLGRRQSATTVNLDPEDGRTCGIVTTDKGITLIVAHFPWMQTRREKQIIQYLITPHVIRNENIIMLADTNDAKTLISADDPLLIAGRPLSQNLTREQVKKRLKTCCWHEQGHQYESYSDTGDYVLAENVLSIQMPYDLPSNTPGESALFSDHSPVVARVALLPS